MTVPVTGDGPWIVRHERVPEVDGGTGWVLHVEAVADRAAVDAAVRRLGVDLDPLASRLTYSRRRQSDGSVVEVEAASWERIADDLRAAGVVLQPEPSAARLAKWNAHFGVQAGAAAGVETEGGRDDG